MREYKYSIIIPTYNAEKYVSECVKSVLNQTYENYEIIIIDDGSTDNSFEIIQKLSTNDNRIHVFHQDNQGQVTTRLNGISYARSDYCLFLDADDYVSNDALSVINDVININPVDMVIFNAYREWKGKKVLFWPEYKEKLWFGTEDAISEIRCEAIRGKRFNNICLKAVKTTIVQSKQFKKIPTYVRKEEDLLMQLPYFDEIKSVAYIPRELYIYRNNENGISKKFISNQFEGDCYVDKVLKKYGKKWNVPGYEEYCNKRFLESVNLSVKQLWGSRKPVYKDFAAYLRKISQNEYFRNVVMSKKYKLGFNTRIFTALIYHRLYFIAYIIVKKRNESGNGFR